MFNIKLITITVLLVAVQCQGRPSAGVEIAKQHLVKFPDVHDRKSEEQTKKILLEIDRINQNLGYVKRTQPTPPQLKSAKPPVESYFFPRDRQLFQRAIYPQNYVMIIPYPFNMETFFYPSPYLELPNREARKFTNYQKGKKYLKTSGLQKTFKYDDHRTNVIEPAIIEAKNETVTTSQKPPTKQPDLIDTIIDEVVDDSDEDDDDDDDDDEYDDDESKEAINKKADSKPMDLQPIRNYINNLYKNILVVPKVPVINKTTAKVSDEKSIGQNTTENIRIYNPFLKLKKKKKTEDAIIESQVLPDVEKSPFGFFRPAESALKEGGIVIQRLKVKKGGIAIAGPGGVATAGSGGTAIVGPGGIALTHPRGLAIAGPGARVFSVPENIDLGKFANASQGRGFPFPGATVVATGPVVYYNTGYN